MPDCHYPSHFAGTYNCKIVNYQPHPPITKHRLCLDKYDTLVGEKYKEPVNGKFEDATDSMLQRLKEPEDSADDKDLHSDFDLDLQDSYFMYSEI